MSFVLVYFCSISSQDLYTRFMLTDRALEDVPTWPNVQLKINYKKIFIYY